MRKLIKILTLSLFFISFGYAQTAEEITNYIQYDKISLAKETGQKWVEKQPKKPEPYYYLGLAFAADSDYVNAKMNFEKGIQADDDFALNYIGLGKIAIMQNDFNSAKMNFDKALDIEDEEVSILVALGDAYLANPKEYSNQAIEYLKKAEELDKKKAASKKSYKRNYRLYILLGDAYNAQNNFSEANNNYQKALNLEPTSVYALTEKAKIYTKVNLETAEGYFKEALAIDPNYSPAYRILAEEYYNKKMYDKAITNYLKYIEMSGAAAKSYRRLSEMYYRNKEFVKASESINKALELQPDQPYALRLKSYYIYEAGDSVAAEKAFDHYFATVKPEELNSLDFETYGNVLFKLGKDSLAAESFKKAYSLDTNKADLLVSLSSIYTKMKKWDEVVKTITLKIVKDPDGGTAVDYFDLGRANYYQLAFPEALNAFDKVISKKADFLPAWTYKARINATIDSTAKLGLATEAYEQVILLTAKDTVKYKKDIIEANSYLAYHYFMIDDYEKSKVYYEKVVAMDPTNASAIEALNFIAKQNKNNTTNNKNGKKQK